MNSKDQHTKYRIALLEHAMSVEPYSLLLKEKNFNVVIAGHVWNEVINKIRDIKPDALLMDLGVDGSVDTGYLIIAECKKVSPSTKVVVVTSSDEKPVYLSKAIKSGADGYVSRRKTGVAIETAIQAAIEGFMVISPNGLLNDLVDISISAIEYDEDVRVGAEIKLTEVERELLIFLGKEYSNKDIIEHTRKKEATIKGQLRVLYQKLGVNNRHDAVRCAKMNGLL